MADYLLCLNSGSSSLKFALYDALDLQEPKVAGVAEEIGLPSSRLRTELKGRPIETQPLALDTHERALDAALVALRRFSLPGPTACVHRVVHGGPRLIEPALITGAVRRELEGLVALAPLHLPRELAVIEAASRLFPDAPQIACFDTAFHDRLPEIARSFPLPRDLREKGIRRYGFHGLSYESVLSQLGDELRGRAILAHLGNGCSMAAVKDGVPQDTTMGLTPTGGLMMGTRSGDLDPGVLFYLLRHAAGGAADAVDVVERIINDESGLKGVSSVSRDMQELLRSEAESRPSREAVDLFCYCASKAIGALCSVLGGLDALVFTGGIGESSGAVRRRICEGLGFLGIRIDPARNESHGPVISSGDSACRVLTVRTRENQVMASHAIELLSRQTSRSSQEGR